MMTATRPVSKTRQREFTASSGGRHIRLASASQEDGNLYLYEGDNPINRLDPTGLQATASGPATTTSQPALNGTFSVNMKDFSVQDAQGRDLLGLEGTIEFQPNASTCPKCKKIRLIQIVRTQTTEWDNNTKDYKDWDFTNSPVLQNSMFNKIMTDNSKDKNVIPGFHIDIFPQNFDPKSPSMFYRDYNGDHSQDGSNMDDASVASLYDKPTALAGWQMHFETVAVCIDTGKYLGAVTWGFQSVLGQVSALEPHESAEPSATFLAAVAKFNEVYKK